MQSPVEIHGSTWKLEDISEDIAWCLTQQWTLSQYEKANDHSHCRICWWSITMSDDPEIGVAFCANDDLWLCQECYRKFIDHAA